MSKEHVPPRVFFPEKKDSPSGTDFRRNLITVPSCAEHNLSKSMDDMYTAFVIAIHFENKPAAQRHFSTKMMRAIRNRPAMVNFLKNLFPATVGGLPSAGFQVDRHRFDGTLEQIARALYYHHYGAVWEGAFVIHTPDLFMLDGDKAGEVNARMRQIEAMTVQKLGPVSVFGGNPQIFRYQHQLDTQMPSFLVRMVFYEGFVVIAYSSPSIGQASGDA